MHLLKFKHNGQKYHLDMGTQTLKNLSTGEACAVCMIRDFDLIEKVSNCISDAQSEKYYEIIVSLMIGNIDKEINKGTFYGFNNWKSKK